MEVVVKCGICGEVLFRGSQLSWIQELPEEVKRQLSEALGLLREVSWQDPSFARDLVLFSIALRHLSSNHPEKLRELVKVEMEP
ncbi:MAG: hypothetical protein DSO02_02245 [Hadesarchaea archaeon]|nr:MAG: hypothetical protein DSO03_02500 [Hadesarchaea archaeon]TDA34649.1 MAG: hypothetical protein DSO02_02245 [Hadesarchaea archaeon]